MSIIAEIELLLTKAKLLAQHLGTDVEAVWESFEAFVKKEIGKAEEKKADEPITPPTPPAA